MIGFIVAGLIIGALARLIKPGKQSVSLLWTLLLGLAGSVIGGVIASLLGTGDIFELNVLGFIVAVIASVALVGVAEAVSGRSQRDRFVPREPRAHVVSAVGNGSVRLEQAEGPAGMGRAFGEWVSNSLLGSLCTRTRCIRNRRVSP